MSLGIELPVDSHSNPLCPPARPAAWASSPDTATLRAEVDFPALMEMCRIITHQDNQLRNQQLEVAVAAETEQQIVRQAAWEAINKRLHERTLTADAHKSAGSPSTIMVARSTNSAVTNPLSQEEPTPEAAVGREPLSWWEYSWRRVYNWTMYITLASSYVPGVDLNEANKPTSYYVIH